MSSYREYTEHPETKQPELAEWLDNYFGNHNYGVRFPSDGKVFRADEFDWLKASDADPLSPIVGTPLDPRNEMPITILLTEKGSYFDNPMHELKEEDGKETITTKHEDGRQDVKITVNRLDLKDPTPEDKIAEEKIIDALSNTKVGVLVIHAQTRQNIYFTCPIPSVRKNSQMVIDNFLTAYPEYRMKAELNGEKVEDQFIIIESAVVTEPPKVTKL